MVIGKGLGTNGVLVTSGRLNGDRMLFRRDGLCADGVLVTSGCKCVKSISVVDVVIVNGFRFGRIVSICDKIGSEVVVQVGIRVGVCGEIGTGVTVSVRCVVGGWFHCVQGG